MCYHGYQPCIHLHSKDNSAQVSKSRSDGLSIDTKHLFHTKNMSLSNKSLNLCVFFHVLPSKKHYAPESTREQFVSSEMRVL